MQNKRQLELRKRLYHTRPADKEELRLWTKLHFGIDLTTEAVCPHHNSQLDYLDWTVNGRGDSFTLACRNGGKTQLAAVATDYDSEFRSPIRTIFVGGCLHPSSPVLTLTGFKPIIEIRKGEMVFDGETWGRVTGTTARPAVEHLKVSFIGLPPLYLTHGHPLFRIKGIKCPIPNRVSPRVCPDDVKCAYHRRRFKCKGHGDVREVPASEIGVGDALMYPLRYTTAMNSYKPTISPLLQGILFGSHCGMKKGKLFIYKRLSISREYDRYVLDSIRQTIASETKARTIKQSMQGHSFAICYDADFFKDYHLGTQLPYNFFLWSVENQNEFIKGALSGTRFTIFNQPSYLNAFATARHQEFAQNLFALVAKSRPRFDHISDKHARLIFADSSIPEIKDLLPNRFSSLKPTKRRSNSQPILNIDGWGDSLGAKVKAIEECPPSVPFIDIEVEGGKRFLTLWGMVHNSELQAGHMYRYTKKPYDKERGGIAAEDVTSLGVRELSLKNGSNVKIIASSVKAAGGFHVERIKIDQIDDMDQDVYETLQFDINMASDMHTQVDMLGTWDKLGGLYDEVLQLAELRGQKIFRWCLLDIIEPCKDRKCSLCDLSDCCGGIARDKREGYLKIDKAIEVRKRLITQNKWDVQMLLRKPRPLEAIIPKFNDTAPFIRTLKYNPVLPTRRGFDWGTRANFACVWVQYDEHEDRLYVIDELMGKPRTGAIECAELTLAYESREGYRNILASYGDPSGAAWIRDFILKGVRVMSLFVPKETRMMILNQMLEVRKDGLPGIVISTKCKKLRDELLAYDIRCYEKRNGAPPDHLVDALLYLLGGMRYVLKLRDASPPGTISIKKSQEQSRIEKFSPEIQKVLEMSKGKTDYDKLLR